MKFIKVFIEFLVLCAIFFIVFRAGGIFINNVLGIHILQVGGTCCGLEEGSIVLFREFNPATLQHGEIILLNDPQTGKTLFTQVIAFPGENLFKDLYIGKWGYAEKVKLEKAEIIEITEEEISNLFAKITWLDSPTFQPTVLSENLYDRLFYFYEDQQKYRTANDIDPKLPYSGAITAEHIIGVYNATLVSANNAWLYYIIIWATLFIVFLAISILLSRIFKKLKKNKSLADMPQPPTV